MTDEKEIDDATLRNSEAFKRFAKTGDPEALSDVLLETTGVRPERIEIVETVAAKAKRALAALRFRMIPELPDDMKELAYQQVLAALNLLDDFESREYTTNTGQKLANIHAKSACAARRCAIHNPSNHHMRDWPMEMRTDLFAFGLMERFCEHGVGHPDPDSAKYLDEHGPEGSRGTWTVHGCDGCCAKPE